MIHETPISVRFYELDPYRHLNHSVYIQYFEVGRIDLFRALGWTLSGLADMGTQVFATAIETSFVAPAVEGDDLVVESWVEELKRVTGNHLCIASLLFVGFPKVPVKCLGRPSPKTLILYTVIQSGCAADTQTMASHAPWRDALCCCC